LPLIIEGTTEKVMQYVMPPKSIYTESICFNEQNSFF
jgi:hypothetical protein